jgi:DNA-binding transcriptional MocR family regulator
MKKTFPEGIIFTRSQEGIFAWVELSANINVLLFLKFGLAYNLSRTS